MFVSVRDRSQASVIALKRPKRPWLCCGCHACLALMMTHLQRPRLRRDRECRGRNPRKWRPERRSRARNKRLRVSRERQLRTAGLNKSFILTQIDALVRVAVGLVSQFCVLVGLSSGARQGSLEALKPGLKCAVKIIAARIDDICGDVWRSRNGEGLHEQ